MQAFVRLPSEFDNLLLNAAGYFDVSPYLVCKANRKPISGSCFFQIGTDTTPYTETTAITLEAPVKLPHFSHLGTLVVEGGSLNIFGKDYPFC